MNTSEMKAVHAKKDKVLCCPSSGYTTLLQMLSPSVSQEKHPNQPV